MPFCYAMSYSVTVIDLVWLVYWKWCLSTGIMHHFKWWIIDMNLQHNDILWQDQYLTWAPHAPMILAPSKAMQTDRKGMPWKLYRMHQISKILSDDSIWSDYGHIYKLWSVLIDSIQHITMPMDKAIRVAKAKVVHFFSRWAPFPSNRDSITVTFAMQVLVTSDIWTQSGSKTHNTWHHTQIWLVKCQMNHRDLYTTMKPLQCLCRRTNCKVIFLDNVVYLFNWPWVWVKPFSCSTHKDRILIADII